MGSKAKRTQVWTIFTVHEKKLCDSTKTTTKIPMGLRKKKDPIEQLRALKDLNQQKNS
jgi:hypothetical protein